MPIYEYECSKCKEIFEVFQFPGEAEREIPCPTCKEYTLKRVMSCFSANTGTARPSSRGGCAPAGGG